MTITDNQKKFLIIYSAVFVLLLTVNLIFSFYFYSSWNKPLPQDPEILQIKLPVMKWAEYSTLSKRYENGIIVGSSGEREHALSESDVSDGTGAIDKSARNVVPRDSSSRDSAETVDENVSDSQN